MPQVKLITDNEIVFKLNDEDINAGIRSQMFEQQFEDPIAQALKKIGHYRKVYVGWASLTGYKGPVFHEFDILNYKEVREFLVAWDKGQEVSLITVKLFFKGETRIPKRGTTRLPKKREKAFIASDGRVGF